MAGDLVLSRPMQAPTSQGRGTVRAPAALEACLSQIDARVAQSFSAEQLRALEIMLEVRRTKRHKIDFRHSLSWGSKRYYVSLFFGRDRRNLVRKPDGPAYLEADRAGSGLGWLAWLVLTLPLVLCGLYVLMTLAGIELAAPEFLGRFFP